MSTDKKEIYTYEAPWLIYGMNWSNRPSPKFRLAVGSFLEDYKNAVDIIQLEENDNGSAANNGKFHITASFLHPYPTTKIMFSPDKSTIAEDLIATSGDYLRLWKIDPSLGATAEGNHTKMVSLFSNNKSSEFCAPLTSFDWNETDPSIVGTSSIDTTCFGLDARILTNRGFMFYEEIVCCLKQIETDQSLCNTVQNNLPSLFSRSPLLYACYDASMQSIVYRPGKLVTYANNKGKLVSFTPRDEKDSNNLSLRVTSDHIMYCQVGDKGLNANIQPDRVVASALMRPTCECEEESQCKNCQAKVRFVSVAEHGVNHDRMDGDCLPSFEEELYLNLGLEGIASINAFLELYGYWLGCGSMRTHQVGNSTSYTIHFGESNQIDLEFIKEKLNILRLSEVIDFYCSTVLAEPMSVHITNPRWFSYFHTTYGASQNPHSFFWWILQRCSRDQLRLLIEGLRHAEAKSSDSIYTASAAFRDDLMIALLHAGYTAYFELDDTNKAGTDESVFWRICYATESSYPSIAAQDIHEEAYTELLWCVEVEHPDHLIIAQRATKDKVNGELAITKASRPVVVGNCTIWNIQTGQAKTQLIAHDKEVYDLAFAPSADIFASAGADGSVRMFDLRSLEHSTIIYESNDFVPLLRVIWNKHNSNYLATFLMDQNSVIILDTRSPSVPLAELTGHNACVNSIAWAPHSDCHICTGGDDCQALIWDLTPMPKPISEPILAYNAEGEINTLQWSAAQPEWVAITFNKKLQILRV